MHANTSGQSNESIALCVAYLGVHERLCPNFDASDFDKLIELAWQPQLLKSFKRDPHQLVVAQALAKLSQRKQNVSGNEHCYIKDTLSVRTYTLETPLGKSSSKK